MAQFILRQWLCRIQHNRTIALKRQHIRVKRPERLNQCRLTMKIERHPRRRLTHHIHAHRRTRAWLLRQIGRLPPFEGLYQLANLRIVFRHLPHKRAQPRHGRPHGFAIPVKHNINICRKFYLRLCCHAPKPSRMAALPANPIPDQ